MLMLTYDQFTSAYAALCTAIYTLHCIRILHFINMKFAFESLACSPCNSDYTLRLRSEAGVNPYCHSQSGDC